jgi:hypothetical protein
MADSKDSSETVVSLSPPTPPPTPLSLHSPIQCANASLQDYSLSNPDTLTKLKTAADISQKVLVKVKQACVPGANILQICQQGDSLLEEETSKVYKGKKIPKGSLCKLEEKFAENSRNRFSDGNFTE